MGRIGRLIESFFNDRSVRNVSVNLGADNNVDIAHSQPCNEDSLPLPNDFVVSVPVEGEDNIAAVGYVDPTNQGESSPVQPGEKRIYSRDSSGAIVAEAHFKADGTLYIKSKQGITVDSSNGVRIIGTVIVEGDIAATGDITADGDVKAGAISLLTHTHNYTTPQHPSAVGPTGVPQ